MLKVHVLEALSDDLVDQECGVVVYGISNEHTEDLLRCYFENQKRSGGGDVEDVYFDEYNNSAMITFSDQQGMYFILAPDVHCKPSLLLTRDDLS